MRGALAEVGSWIDRRVMELTRRSRGDARSLGGYVISPRPRMRVRL